MKLLCSALFVAAALGAAGVSRAAPPEVYVLAGPVWANLGSDGTQFGRDLADEMTLELPGTDWRAAKSGKFGPDFALGVHTHDGRTVGGALELRYVRRGVKYTLTDHSLTYPETGMKLHLDFLEIPLLVQITPPMSGPVEAMFLAGPAFSINTNSSLEVSAGGTSASGDFADAVSDTHLDAMLGAGARIRTGPDTALLVTARLSYDLGNVFKDPSPYDVRSRDVSLLVGYAFGR